MSFNRGSKRPKDAQLIQSFFSNLKNKVTRNLKGGAERAYCNANPMHNANEGEKREYEQDRVCDTCSITAGTSSGQRGQRRKCERACKNKKEEAREDAVAACQQRSRRKQQRVRDKQSDERHTALEAQRKRAQLKQLEKGESALKRLQEQQNANKRKCVEEYGPQVCSGGTRKWKQYLSKRDNYPYWNNGITSQWEDPWKQRKDPTSGGMYWYTMDPYVSQWEDPHKYPIEEGRKRPHRSPPSVVFSVIKAVSNFKKSLHQNK